MKPYVPKLVRAPMIFIIETLNNKFSQPNPSKWPNQIFFNKRLNSKNIDEETRLSLVKEKLKPEKSFNSDFK